MANPGKVRDSSRKSKSKRRGQMVDWEKFEDSEVFERDGGICGYCGAEPKGKNRTVDHMQPLDRGGLHALDNCVTACQSCNFKKHTALPLNFIFGRSA